MLAAMATAVPLPNLSLTSLATESQTSCLREEITTLAPCSAIRSAMARPMPRVEPVMTADFPVMSNKVMRCLPCCPVCAGFVIGSGKFRRRHFRPGGLMHRGVFGAGDPWLLVDHRNAPARMAVAGEMVEPGHRAIVD